MKKKLTGVALVLAAVSLMGIQPAEACTRAVYLGPDGMVVTGRTMDWKEVIQSIEASRNLLEALWQLNAEAVANGIDQAHQEISILQYNDENALSCTISLAFYFAREYYTIIRELPTGKGFADLCFIPRRLYADKPAAVIELKWDKKAEGAISQIKNKGYVDALKDYHGDLLLAGINYDKKTKKHTCVIEKYNK